MARNVGRLGLAILATLAEEIAVILIVFLVLPRFGIHLPRPALIGLVVGVAVWGGISCRFAKRALEKEPMVGLPDMVGTRGRVAEALAPGGVVKIKNELWEAKSAGGGIDAGEEVVVVEQNVLKLTVRRSGSGNSK